MYKYIDKTSFSCYNAGVSNMESDIWNPIIYSQFIRTKEVFRFKKSCATQEHKPRLSLTIGTYHTRVKFCTVK